MPLRVPGSGRQRVLKRLEGVPWKSEGATRRSLMEAEPQDGRRPAQSPSRGHPAGLGPGRTRAQPPLSSPGLDPWLSLPPLPPLGPSVETTKSTFSFRDPILLIWDSVMSGFP